MIADFWLLVHWGLADETCAANRRLISLAPVWVFGTVTGLGNAGDAMRPRCSCWVSPPTGQTMVPFSRKRGCRCAVLCCQILVSCPVCISSASTSAPPRPVVSTDPVRFRPCCHSIQPGLSSCTAPGSDVVRRRATSAIRTPVYPVHASPAILWQGDTRFPTSFAGPVDSDVRATAVCLLVRPEFRSQAL